MAKKIKTVNSLSAGESSSYLAVHFPADFEIFSVVCIDDERCRIQDSQMNNYINTKLEKFIPEFGEFIATAENDESLYAMRDLEQILGREIIWLRGMSFDNVIDEGTKSRLPSWARRYCTEKMKLLPIFLWWFNSIGEKCNMRIGFRFDEYKRMERFFNNSDPVNFKIPVSCKNYGQKRQQHETFNWRYCSMPLVENAITKTMVKDYWSKNGFIGTDDLFQNKRQIKFPVISNCIGCFHKNEDILAAMSHISPQKFQWFIDQELKGKGKWLDSKITYQHLSDNRFDIAKENIYEITKLNESCDSGGCTA